MATELGAMQVNISKTYSDQIRRPRNANRNVQNLPRLGRNREFLKSSRTEHHNSKRRQPANPRVREKIQDCIDPAPEEKLFHYAGRESFAASEPRDLTDV